MVTIIRTDSKNQDFKSLVKELDAYLKVIDGDDHDFYNQFNDIDVLQHVVIVYLNNKAVGCGAFKKFNESSVEIKRMFTNPKQRKVGVATKILLELEKWANELSYKSVILETGKTQVEAVNFYKKSNYKIIKNYGQYKNVLNSLCFKKFL